MLDSYGTHKHEKVLRWLKKHKWFYVHFTLCRNFLDEHGRDVVWHAHHQAIRRGSFDSVAHLIGTIKACLAPWNEERRI